MSLMKQSQSIFDDLEGHDVSLVDDEIELPAEEEPLMVAEDHEEPVEIVLEPTSEPVVMFQLDSIPGAEDQEPITVEEESEPENEDDWKPSTFISWIHRKLNAIPRHSGKDILGCERVLSYFDYLDREATKAARQDLKNEIDIAALEKIKDEIYRGKERILDRIEQLERTKYKKTKKRGEETNTMEKTAASSGMVGTVVVTVPLLISSLARSLINSSVSAGKDIEKTFEKLAKEYKLDNREKLELIQLVRDMGYFVRRDLGMPMDVSIDTSSPDNCNWMPNYPA